MASRYHWVTPSRDTIGAVPSSLQNLDVSLPAGAIVKRFQVRNTYCVMHTSGTDNTTIRAPYMNQQVHFTTGPNSGRIIYESKKIIPMQWHAFEAVTIPVFDWWAVAGDKELGVDQGCSYGKSSGAAATLELSYFIASTPAYSGTYQGELAVEFAVLYWL